MGYLPGEYLSSDSQVRAWGTRISFYFDCSGSVNLKMAAVNVFCRFRFM